MKTTTRHLLLATLGAVLATNCGNNSTPGMPDTPDNNDAAIADRTVPEVRCAPDCTGRNCGPDGCGGTCGKCEDGQVCLSDGSCLCIPACDNKMCGPDGCGKNCGLCPDAYSCMDGMCISNDCVPDCAGKECGTDGCGGTCGGCPSDWLCSSDGECVCIPDCSDNKCGGDGCGGICGECGPSFSCKAGACVPDPCQPACGDALCGEDGCGGICGTCPENHVCGQGKCFCIPDCAGKNCGDDGCGGKCGTCPSAWECDSDQCLCQPDCNGKSCGNDGCGDFCGECDFPQQCLSNQCGCADKSDVACCPNSLDLCWADSCGLTQEPIASCPHGCDDGNCLPCKPDCTGKTCGPDGCSGVCGICPKGFSCAADGTCIEQPCQAACAGKQCGNDGCGGVCGQCTDGKQCINHSCKCTSPDHVACCTDATGLCLFDSCGAQVESIHPCPSGCENASCLACTPDCTDKQCGPDGCGGTCGLCTLPLQCQNGQCSCDPDCQGKSCGPDGCGGNCGGCQQDWLCSAEGKCVCVPKCADKQCGPDGCGQQCALCPDGHDCEEGTCVKTSCQPQCQDKFCGPDGCGGVCGSCGNGQLCSSDGGCVCLPQCDDVMCGDNGCGGSCAVCPAQYLCENGACIKEDCQPDCAGKQCGPDGCGGKCGSCPASHVCTSGGTCVCLPSCQGKMCGPDGCGGYCGGCPFGYSCDNYICSDASCIPDCDGKECGSDNCTGQCGQCPDPGYCDDGKCYDCSEEGFCNAVSCPSDNNPCTLEVIIANGQCASVLNWACSEPVSNLQRIYRGAQAYYVNWKKDPVDGKTFVPLQVYDNPVLPLVAGPTPPQGTCCQKLGGADSNGNNACDSKWGYSLFTLSPWEFLDFDAGQEFHYVYSFEEVGDGAPSSAVLFRAQAVGDLDCDGKMVTFVVQGRFQHSGQPAGDYFKASQYLNPLMRPKWMTYTAEEGAVYQVSSVWPAPIATNSNTHLPFEITIADTYQSRFSEALENLLKIYRGAKRYYGIPKAATGTPGCQLRPAAKTTLANYEGIVPTSQQPLMQGLTPVEATCCGSYGGPDNNGDNMCDPDPDVFSTQTWTDVGFKLLGSFQNPVNFKQYEEDNDAFEFRTSAYSDLDCDGDISVFTLRATAQPDPMGGCAIERAKAVQYSLLYLPEVVVGVALPDPQLEYSYWSAVFSGMFGQLQEDAIPLQETFEYIFADQVDHLDFLVDLVGQYWEANCSFPEFPPKTPDTKSCCSEDSINCPVDAQAWQHPFWAGIGFSIDEPHPFIYEVISTPVGGAVQVLLMKSSADNNCDGWMPNTIERVGIAEAYEDGTCAFIKVDGFNVTRLFD